jgi:hypothetical protein
MRSLTFDELLAMLSAVQLSADAVARLREWIAGIAHPAECIALIEQVTAGRPCPHCGCCALPSSSASRPGHRNNANTDKKSPGNARFAGPEEG